MQRCLGAADCTQSRWGSAAHETLAGAGKAGIRRGMEGDDPIFDELTLWQDPRPQTGPWNMAVDQALLEQGGCPVLRVYAWDRPTVTLGYAQNLAKLAAALPDWPVVRRWTGGGVVFHGEDFTYTLMVPAGHPWAEVRPVESYRMVHQSLAQALVAAGWAGCRLAESEDVKDLPFCFEAPALHDVIRGPMKVAGAGQRRGRLGLLHQGSVQRVRLEPGFWPVWAGRLARRVQGLDAASAVVAQRAAELVEKRYGRSEWLQNRDDLLTR